MALKYSLNAWGAALFASLGIGPLSGCGGTTDGAGSSDSGAGASSAGGAGGASGGTGGMPFPCNDPTPVLGPDGADTGFVECRPGYVHRVSVETCGSALPRAQTCESSSVDPSFTPECDDDSDCTAQPNGQCNAGVQAPDCYCGYGCTTDADCGDGQLCLCGDPVGQCVQADCTTDADCDGGFCSQYISDPGCGGPAFACQTAQDTCASDADCNGDVCTLTDGVHACSPVMCVIGRPFLVFGTERLAPVVRTDAWLDRIAPSTSGLDPEIRQALAEHWTRTGAMEHASIAAFARFALQLMALGAPADLVEQTHAAMADETRHAKTAFALASAYAGSSVGPGPLPIEGALDEGAAEAIVRMVVREGCIGETIAAVEAGEARERASDPVVRDALSIIALDETRHAELAWRFIRWIAARNPAARRAAITEIAKNVGSPVESAVTAPLDDALLSHGVLSGQLRSEVRRRVLREVVAPCAREIVSTSDTSGTERRV